MNLNHIPIITVVLLIPLLLIIATLEQPNMISLSTITLSDYDYENGYWVESSVPESSQATISSIMVCDNPTKKIGSGWSCGTFCNSNLKMHTLKTFEDGSSAYICTKHIDYYKFEYDMGIVKLLDYLTDEHKCSVDWGWWNGTDSTCREYCWAGDDECKHDIIWESQMGIEKN